MASTSRLEVIEATVFRTIGVPPPQWESLLPPELLRIPEELARVDGLLDDPAFFARSLRTSIRCWAGPSTPIECYLRLMFLKSRYRLGYDTGANNIQRFRTDMNSRQEGARGRGLI